jgi:hypothetical protein
MARRVPFVVAELRADVDPFVLQRFAALAEQERSLADIDANRQASQEPRRGATLGSPKLYPEALKAATAPFAPTRPTSCPLSGMQKAGPNTMRAATAALNARGIPTVRGGAWGTQCP